MTNVVGRRGGVTRRTPVSAARWGRLASGERRWRARGQSLVEFALVAPLFFLLFFGIIEFSLVNASIGAFNFAAKDGARFGAIKGKAATVQTGPTTSIPTDQYIVNNVILPHVAGVVVAQATEIEIYNANEDGSCVLVGGVCQEDIWQLSGGTWTSTNGWPYSQREDSLANADYLGVRIHYTYTYLTAFFAVSSPSVNLMAESIQRIEPQEYGDRPAPPTSAWVSAPPAWLPFASLPTPLFGALWARLDQPVVPGGRA